jgi:hypothetical protein
MERNFGPFRDACRCGRLDEAKRLALEMRITPEEARANGNFTLQLACAHGHTLTAQWLVSAFGLGPDDARSLDNLTLRWSCENGHTETAQWLVKTFGLTAGDARTLDNWALHGACARRHTATARWLLDWLELPGDVRAGVLSRISAPSPEVVSLLEDWSKPPGPEDKPALDES